MSHRGPDGGPVHHALSDAEEGAVSGPSPADPEQARQAAAEWARWEEVLSHGRGVVSPARAVRQAGPAEDSPSKRARVGIDGGGQDDVEFEEAEIFGPEEGRQDDSPVATEAGSTAATERADGLERTVPFVSDFDPEKSVPATPPCREWGSLLLDQLRPLVPTTSPAS